MHTSSSDHLRKLFPGTERDGWMDALQKLNQFWYTAALSITLGLRQPAAVSNWPLQLSWLSSNTKLIGLLVWVWWREKSTEWPISETQLPQGKGAKPYHADFKLDVVQVRDVTKTYLKCGISSSREIQNTKAGFI